MGCLGHAPGRKILLMRKAQEEKPGWYKEHPRNMLHQLYLGFLSKEPDGYLGWKNENRQKDEKLHRKH